MEKFTKIEIEWLIDILEQVAATFYRDSKSSEYDETTRAFARLRYEQYTNMAARLKKVLLDGNKKEYIMNDKVKRHKDICDELNSLYERKNHDYGDSFHQTFTEEGMAMPRIRLGDKFSRFKTLTQSEDQQVTDESIRDTLLDLANYAIMTVMELEEMEAVVDGVFESSKQRAKLVEGKDICVSDHYGGVRLVKKQDSDGHES